MTSIAQNSIPCSDAALSPQRIMNGAQHNQQILVPSDFDHRLTSLKEDTRRLFEQMKQILTAQGAQLKANSADIETLDSQLDVLRSDQGFKTNQEMDQSKKMLHLEREISKVQKQFGHEIGEMRTQNRDTENSLKNLRLQVEQSTASVDFKAQEYHSSLHEMIQSHQLKLDSIERSQRKLNQDIEVSVLNHIPLLL